MDKKLIGMWGTYSQSSGFGEIYEEYVSKTGRFFPKIKKINKK